MKKNILLFLLTFFIPLLSFQCGKNEKELVIWIGGAPQEINFWQEMIDKFKEENGININLVRQPTYSDQRRQSLIVSLQSKQPNPDLFLMDVIWVNQFYNSGWLESFTKYLKESEIKEDDFFEKSLNLIDKYNGELYALPVFMDVALLYYRKDLIKEAGFNKPPDTWNDLVEHSKAVKQNLDNNINGFVWQGAQYEGLVCVFTEFIASNNGGIKTGRKMSINSEENIAALEFMHDMIHKYKISPPNIFTEMKEEEVRRVFQRGNAVFERNWTYAANLHQSEGSDVKGKFGIAVLPHFENGSSSSTLGGWHVGLSKYSDMKEEAWQFIEFLASYEFQKEMLLQIGWNPSRKDVYDDEEIVEKISHIKIMKEVFQNAVARPSIPYYPQISEIIQRNVNNCLAGKLPASSAIENMQKEIDQIVKLYEE